MFSLQSWLSTLQSSKATRHEARSAAAIAALCRFSAMPKLVDEQEFAELHSQAGFDARLVRKLRSERRRTYQLYLSELVTEFRILSTEALDRAANDPGVDEGFAEKVYKARIRFALSVWLLRASLYLPAVSLPRTHQWTVDMVGAMRSAVS